MSRASEKAEALETLKHCLASCEPGKGGTLDIVWSGGRPTNTGRSDYYMLTVWEVGEGAPRPMSNPVWAACKATGCRYNKSRHAVLITGCGYNKAHALASALAHAVGHPLNCVIDGTTRVVKG